MIEEETTTVETVAYDEGEGGMASVDEILRSGLVLSLGSGNGGMCEIEIGSGSGLGPGLGDGGV